MKYEMVKETLSNNLSIPFGEKVKKLEELMLKEPQAECPVTHSFLPGTYIREMKMAAGVLAIGHYHKTAHKNIFFKGRILVPKEDGSVEELVAPMEFIGQPGKKIGYVLEDVVWFNIFETNEQDISVLEEIFLDKEKSTPVYPYHIDPNHQLEYKEILDELGYTEEEVRQQSEIDIDLIPLPFGTYKIAIADSPIEGKGIFATGKIKNGEILAPARLDGYRTPVGRYTNHSNNPNSKMIADIKGDLYLIAIKDICGMAGGIFGEELTTDYRDTRKLVEELEGDKICHQQLQQ
jgi:hypothetical protein